ncbi:META domain-containing protein [Mariniflexile litorale]|uniref:META domain-containing protein n=1 Tax=Mariniflexile litorale TaxID=3045158 RepID=A0AAU7ECQ5_9FLAO|nr:META domain-containing protein [Mariniflexile sp. KMM 9835]MDQ8212262.1 META domain-containing protein [Mariniflexile sp. KMM 9835]
MKSLKISAALVLLIALGTSCTSTKTAKTQNIKMVLHDIWAATHINEEPIPTTENVPNLEINVTEMKVFGTDGCNNYTGGIKNLTSENIALGPLASTRKMCFNMDIPNKYNKALNKAVSYKRDNLNLYFYDSNRNKILSFKKVD